VDRAENLLIFGLPGRGNYGKFLLMERNSQKQVGLEEI
jgi:hypothetical protein